MEFRILFPYAIKKSLLNIFLFSPHDFYIKELIQMVICSSTLFIQKKCINQPGKYFHFKLFISENKLKNNENNGINLIIIFPSEHITNKEQSIVNPSCAIYLENILLKKNLNSIHFFLFYITKTSIKYFITLIF